MIKCAPINAPLPLQIIHINVGSQDDVRGLFVIASTNLDQRELILKGFLHRLTGVFSVSMEGSYLYLESVLKKYNL